MYIFKLINFVYVYIYICSCAVLLLLLALLNLHMDAHIVIKMLHVFAMIIQKLRTAVLVYVTV